MSATQPTCPNCGSSIAANVPNTARQAEVLNYVIDFERRRGSRPSYSQIARHLQIKSKATVCKHIRSLRKQGFLKDVEVEEPKTTDWEQ